MAGKWETQWVTAKKTFETKAGKKKPKASVGDAMSKRVGIRKVLGKCDKFHDAADKLRSQGKMAKGMAALAKLKEQVPIMKRLSESYFKDIQTAMTKEKDKSVMGEMDILRKHLRALSETIIAKAAILEDSFQQISVMDSMAKNLKVALVGCIKRAALFCAQVKQRNDVAVWNEGIQKAARDVYQQVGNVELLRRKHKDVPGIPPAVPTTMIEPLKTWRNGQPKFEAGQEADMQALRNDFLKILQGLERWLKTA